MSALVALGSAICIGGADFVGGAAARLKSPLAVTLWVNSIALAIIAIVSAVAHPQLASSNALGALAGGVISGISLNLIYAAFAAGAISLTAPLIACGTALVPTLTAAAIGQPPDPLQAVGIVFAIGGVITITYQPSAQPEHLGLSRRALGLTASASLVAGASFSILLLSAKGGADVALGVSGLSRLTTCGVCVLLVLVTRTDARLSRPLVRPVFTAGLLEASGATLFLLASSLGNTAVVAVIVSLYSIVTVLLAQTLLRERIAAHQGWGIASAAIGVVMLSAG